MEKIKEDFCFLFVGQWTSNGLFGDRKDIGNLIKTFMTAFADMGVKPKPALIIKTSGAAICNMDKHDIINRLRSVRSIVEQEKKTKDLPNVYILYGELSESEMNALYNHSKVKAHISFTHGEGFCVLEDTPIITSNGLKNIQNIDKTDVVLTHTGNWKKVINPLSRYYDGEMKKISIYNGINSIPYQFTPNHNIYVYRNSEFSWISANELKLTDYLVLPKNNNYTNTKTIKISDYINDPNIILENNYLTYKHSNKTNIKNIKNDVLLSAEFAKICGYFLSEGCVSNGEIIFSLNKNEKNTKLIFILLKIKFKNKIQIYY